MVSIRIHKIHRIITAESIRRNAVVLVCQRVRTGPAAEGRCVVPCSVVRQARIQIDSLEPQLLLAVVAVAVGC